MARQLTIEQIEKIKETLALANRFVIFSHQSPDGDAVGSSLGLMHVLRNLGKTAHVILPDALPQFYAYLPGFEEVTYFQTQESQAMELMRDADHYCFLDFNHLDRMGTALSARVQENMKASWMIDHHQQPTNVSQVLFSDITFTSTSEMVAHFANQIGATDAMDLAAMQCVYTGIVTDTASFRFPVVTAETHRIVADMMDKGLRHAPIHQAIYDTQTENRLRLTGYALSEKLYVDAKWGFAYIALSDDELNRFNHQPGDTEGLVNQALSMQGIQVAAFFRQTPERDAVKCSFRSKGDWDVNAFARAHWNGGGHKNAAGGKFMGSLEEATARFKQQMSQS
jgi:phosphoesterase RecJ-like protein